MPISRVDTAPNGNYNVLRVKLLSRLTNFNIGDLMSAAIEGKFGAYFQKQTGREYIVIALTALVYFGACLGGIYSSGLTRAFAIIWPAAGIALGALLLNPRRLWPHLSAAIFTAGAAANLAAGKPFFVTLGFMTANTLEPLLCAWVMFRICGEKITLNRVKEVLALLVAVLPVNGLTALVGAGTAALAFKAPFLSFWISWVITDGFGILVFAPAVVAIVIAGKKYGRFRWSRLPEMAVSAAAWIFVSLLIFKESGSIFHQLIKPYVLYILLTLFAFRFGQLGVVSAVITLGVIILSGQSHVSGWGDAGWLLELQQHQLFLSVMAVAGMLLAAAVAERRQAGSELIQSEEKFRTAFETSPDAIVLNRMDTGLYTDVNEGFLRTTGYSREDIIGKTSKEIDIWGDYADRARAVEALKKNGFINNMEFKFRLKNKKLVDCLFSANIITIKGVPHILAVVRDISEKKAAERLVLESKEKFKFLFDTMAQGVVIQDENDRIIEANQAACEILGLSMDQILGKSSYDPRWRMTNLDGSAMNPCDAPSVKAQATGKSVTGVAMRVYVPEEKNYRTILTSSVPRFAGGTQTPYQTVTVFTDITENIRIESVLRESEEKFRVAFLNSPDIIGISKLSDGTYVDVNDAFVKYLGYARDEAVGRSLKDVGVWADTKERDLLVGAIREKGGIYNHETKLKKKNGELMDVLFSANTVVLGGEKHILVQVRDITDRKKLEKEKEKLFQELEEKNAELERFVYTVSHDLKSPLITIQGFTGLIQSKLKDTAGQDVKDSLEYIIKAGLTMNNLLKDLLEISRIGRVVNKKEETAFSSLVDSAVSMLNGEIRARNATVTMGQELKDDAFPGAFITCDRLRITEVIQNMVANAIKFTPGNKPPEIKIGIELKKRGEPVYYVADTGRGIEEKYLTQIFKIFERLDASVDGTGIGLAIVKRIIDFHGGEVWAESAGLGRGSTFYFTIPQDKKQVNENT